MSNNLVFGKYEIQHRIAIGGMGEVFFAIQRGVSGFERPVILKSLLPDLAQQQELVNQFLDEARVAATLNHPNVVSIFEVGLWNGTFYIAMEYIRGRNLAQLIRRALEQQVRLPPAVSARIVREAAMGLHHAHVATDASGHGLNIVHRDISPQNIMVREDGVAKVVDFGIASAANRSTRTATGTIKGKLAYMAPEQVLAQSMSPKVDQFALGVVFWELLTCRRLFRAENDLALMKMLLEAPIPRPETFAADVPAPMADVVMRMLDRDAARRFDSLHDVVDALEGLQVTPTPAQSPAAFMRKLGTDDLKIEIKPSTTSGENFVISLNEQSTPAAAAEVKTGALQGLDGATKGSAELKAPRRSMVPFVGAAVALLALGAAAWSFTRPPPNEPTPPPPTVQVVAPPPIVEVVVDAGPSTPPPVAEATLELKTVPAGALLRVDGRPVGASPQRLTMSSGVTHYVLAELSGYERNEIELTLAAAEERSVTLELKARSGKPGTRPTPVASPPLKSDPGFLTIATTPWTKVTIDGELMGSTPIYKIRLTPGAHKVQFINEGEGINVTRSVSVASGETQKLQLKLP